VGLNENAQTWVSVYPISGEVIYGHCPCCCCCCCCCLRASLPLTYRSELGLRRLLLVRLLVGGTAPAARGMAAATAGAEGAKRKEDEDEAGPIKLSAGRGTLLLLVSVVLL